MGIDLKLLPVQGDDSSGSAFSMLELNRDYELHTALRHVKPFELPTFKLKSFVARGADGAQGWGGVDETAYGDRMTYLHARNILKAYTTLNPKEVGPETRAAMAYLRELPQDTLVGLYWH